MSRAFSLLHSYGLHVGVFRADCDSYSEDIIRTVDGNCRVFYIRASNSASMYSSKKSIIETYNKRGARECDFARLNNDFGWKRLPCSFMNENTAFMILTAICMNFFSFFIGSIASVFTELTPTSRGKAFVFHFTTVCAKWTRTARKMVSEPVHGHAV